MPSQPLMATYDPKMVVITFGGTPIILKKGAYTIECPTADEVDAAAKAERKLPDVKFNAPLSGAIHKTAIDGVVTL